MIIHAFSLSTLALENRETHVSFSFLFSSSSSSFKRKKKKKAKRIKETRGGKGAESMHLLRKQHSWGEIVSQPQNLGYPIVPVQVLCVDI
jgi:hypothetical protein